MQYAFRQDGTTAAEEADEAGYDLRAFGAKSEVF